MPIDAAKAVAAEPRSGEISWDRKDVQLYHLGIGGYGLRCINRHGLKAP